MPAGGHFRSRQNMFRYLIDQMRTILNLVLLGWVRIATSLATNARREQVADEETVFLRLSRLSPHTHTLPCGHQNVFEDRRCRT